MYESRHMDEFYKIKICNAVQQEYGLHIYKIAPANRGVYGETWILYANHLRYFVKIDYSSDHQKIFAENLNVLSYLKEQGISFVSSVIKNRTGENYIFFDGGVLAVFDFIDGELSKSYRKESLFEMLAQIYLIPPLNIKIAQEDFSTDCVNYVIENMKRLEELDEHKDLILDYAYRLFEWADFCRKDLTNLFITHGDSGSNIIKNNGKLYIIDWDTPKLAGPERDAWMFVKDISDIALFNSALFNSDIKYSIKKERLAFYCYYNYSYYLKDHLFHFISTKDDMMKRRIRGFVRRFFFKGWIIQQISIIENL